MSDELQTEIVEDSWKNRRAIAWISFIFALVYPCLVVAGWLIDPEISTILLDLSTPVYSLVGANLVAYYTMATWENSKK